MGTGGAAGWGPHPLTSWQSRKLRAHRKCDGTVKAEAQLPVTNFLWSSSIFQTASVSGDQMSRHTSYTTHHLGFRSEVGKECVLLDNVVLVYEDQPPSGALTKETQTDLESCRMRFFWKTYMQKCGPMYPDECIYGVAQQ